jgi:hypothetical protein
MASSISRRHFVFSLFRVFAITVIPAFRIVTRVRHSIVLQAIDPGPVLKLLEGFAALALVLTILAFNPITGVADRNLDRAFQNPPPQNNLQNVARDGGECPEYGAIHNSARKQLSDIGPRAGPIRPTRGRSIASDEGFRKHGDEADNK